MSNQIAAKRLTLLSKVPVGKNAELYNYLLADGEIVHLEYKALRDVVVFTDRKVIIMDVQGFTGKKKEWLAMPYSKCAAFSVESAGTFDLDAECKLWASGIGLVEIEFMKGTDVREIAAVLAKYIK